MSKEQFEREKHYGTAMALAGAMLSEGIISEDDYKQIDTMFTEKYHPLIGTISPISLDLSRGLRD